MDKIFEVDSTAVLSKVSEAAVTHCRQERDGGRTWDIGKGKRKEEKSTLLDGNNILPFCRPQMSDSLNVTLVLRFETIWVMSKHITQQKHATTSVENHTLRPSCILCNGGHTVTHQTVLTLLSSSVLCQLPLGFYNLYDGEQNLHHWSVQHTSSSTSTKLLVVTITTKVCIENRIFLALSLFYLNYVYSTWTTYWNCCNKSDIQKLSWYW